LDFARAHTLVSSVAANIGLRRYAQAETELQEVEKAARAMADPYLAANADILRCRLFLSEGSPEAALEAVAGTWSRGPTPWREMEFLTPKAAAVACAGEPRRALRLLRDAAPISRSLEPRILLRWIRGVCLLMLDDPSARREISEIFDATATA